jgi:putative phage-type endonuclease
MSAAVSPLRRKALGASEISAVMGVNPYLSAWDLWARKTGELQGVPIETNPRMRVGKAIERGIADAYAQETGFEVEWSDRTVVHPKRPWQCCTPDAYVRTSPERRGWNGGVDCKAVAMDQFYEFGDPGTDAVPDHVSLQCQWTCSTLDCYWWDVAACTGSELRIYTVLRDLELEGMLLEAGDEFWRKHVLANVPPPMTATPTASAFLKHKHPRGNGILRVPTGEEAVIIEDFLLKRAVLKAAKDQYDDAEVKLKAAIGDDDGFRFAGHDRITYKRIKDSTGYDYEALARWAAGDDLERLQKQFYGVTRPGYRRLDVRVSEAKS